MENVIPHGPPIYTDDPTLKKGVVKQTDSAHDSTDMTIQRRIIVNGQVVKRGKILGPVKTLGRTIPRGDEGGEIEIVDAGLNSCANFKGLIGYPPPEYCSAIRTRSSTVFALEGTERAPRRLGGAVAEVDRARSSLLRPQASTRPLRRAR